MESQTITLSQAMAIAVGHHRAGRLAEAEGIYRQVLLVNPREANVMQLLGTLLGQRGDLNGAEETIRKALEIRPGMPDAYFNLGEFLRRLGRLGEALATVIEGMRYRPGAAAYDNMAAILRGLKCDEAAVDALKTAIRFDPLYVMAFVNLGVALGENGRVEEAQRAFEEAERIRPGWDEPRRLMTIASARVGNAAREKLVLAEVTDSRLCVALSAAFSHLHRHEDAIAAAKRASELEPGSADPYINLGWLFSVTGRLDEAAAACERAIELNPGDAPAHLNLGMIALRKGDFARGWELYEFRKKCLGSRLASYSEPEWDGKALNGKRILLWFEQGLGDTIQFLRYLPLVEEKGGKIVLMVQPELRRLVEGSVRVEEFADGAGKLPRFEVQCSLLSLAKVMGTRVETIPGGAAYLKPSKELIDKWARRIGDLDGGGKPHGGAAGVRGRALRVGVAWAGWPGHFNDANRSMTLKDLGPLAERGAVFFSLQKGKTGVSHLGAESMMNIVDWTGEFVDMADTAGLIANLDLVISVDTSVAHLAGAMGARVWLLLPKTADWRWLMDREDSPWYPTMRLFRQEKVGDWMGVAGRVANEMGNLRFEI